MPSSLAVSATPTIRTPRLVLGKFETEDAPELQRLAGAREIADTTLSIPHPYGLDHALAWIGNQRKESVRGRAMNFAVRLVPSSALIGSVGLRIVRFGFEELGLNRIYAHHMARNPAAGRVLRHIGMQQEGVLRERVRKWGVYEDVVVYAILREDRN